MKDDVLPALQGGLIVSCQALADEPLHGSAHMAVMAVAAQRGGAAGIRANSPEDIAAIRRVCDLTLIGIEKRDYPGSPVYITPTIREVDRVVEAGAQIVALDATDNPRPGGLLFPEFLAAVRKRHGRIPVMADVSTLEEGIAAVAAGADMVSTTLAGYTPATAHLRGPAFGLLKDLVAQVPAPVFAEGRIWTPEECCRAFALGAFAVVVGSAITRPQEITRRFVDALRRPAPVTDRRDGMGPTVYAAGIDIGGTKVRAAVVDEEARVVASAQLPSMARAGPAAVIGQCVSALENALLAAGGLKLAGVGVASAGRIDSERGTVLFATDTFSDWAGTRLREVLAQRLDLPVWVDNDVNAAALAEAWRGAAQGISRYAMVALGTGVGGALWEDGKIARGVHHSAGEFGHMIHEWGGRPCGCGNRGCYEAYLAVPALLEEYARHAKERVSGEEFIRRARERDPAAASVLRGWAEKLASLLVSLQNAFDPERIVLAGGIVDAQEVWWPDLLEALVRAPVRVEAYPARFGSDAGVIGAARLALEREEAPF